MLIYDTTDEKSFENVRNWMKNIEQNAAPSVNKVSKVSTTLDFSHRAGSEGSIVCLCVCVCENW